MYRTLSYTWLEPNFLVVKQSKTEDPLWRPFIWTCEKSTKHIYLIIYWDVISVNVELDVTDDQKGQIPLLKSKLIL